MPPKKKVNKPNEQPENLPKPSEKDKIEPELKKQQPKHETKVNPQPPSQPISTPINRLEQIVSQQLQKQSNLTKTQKISIEESLKLSEEQRIKLRKLRFGALGTDTTIEEAERIKQERLKKFGGSNPDIDQQLLEKRKQKFGLVQSSAVQDLEIAKKRLQKFGSTGLNISQEDKDVLEQRKKKFGSVEADITLNEEINKNKQIKKFHPKYNNNKHGKYGRNSHFGR